MMISICTLCIGFDSFYHTWMKSLIMNAEDEFNPKYFVTQIKGLIIMQISVSIYEA